MINLPPVTPSLSSPKPITSSLPALAPSQDDAWGFPRSLDRVQGPPESKVKVDGGSDRPAASGNDGTAAADSKRALDALGVMQRAAAARQAALRSAAQAAEAAEAAKAGKSGKTTGEGAGTGTVAAEPIVPPTDEPAPGPDIGPDCEFHADTKPTDNAGIIDPPTILPVDVRPSKQTMPGWLPDTSPAEPGLPSQPPKLPPLIEGATSDPRLSAQGPAGPSVKANGVANLPSVPVLAAPPSGRPGALTSTREGDKADAAASPGKPAPPRPITANPIAPLLPADPGGKATDPIPMPILLPGTALRTGTEATPGPAAQNAAAALAAVLPGGEPLRSEPTPQAQLQARPGSSEFAQQLGAQVAVWAKDGLQRASLQLNPLELGPVSVQIQLDGSGAQVMLTADLAATRLALEQALPALAGSLREAGLTLTGGGVFDQARQQAGTDRNGNGNGTGNNPADDSRSTLSALEAERAQRVPMTLPRSRGVVDLMA